MMAKKTKKQPPRKVKDLPPKALTSKQVKDVKGGSGLDAGSKDPAKIYIS
jgi:hypothetical protein